MEVRNLTWVSLSCIPSRGSRGEIAFFHFPASRCFSYSLSNDPLCHQNQQLPIGSFLNMPFLCLSLLPLFSVYKEPWSNRYSPDLKVSHWPCDVTHSSILEIRTLPPLGAQLFFLPYSLKDHFTNKLIRLIKLY